MKIGVNLFMKRLVISIDPGFDGCKIVINKQTYSIPFVVEDITSAATSFPVARSDKKFIRCEYEGRMYLVGEYARKSMLEADHQENAKEEMDTFYTIGRFGTTLFKVGLNAFLGYGLYLYQEYTKDKKGDEVFKIEDMANWDIHLGAALPHQYMEDLWKKYVKDDLTEQHTFVLHIGGEEDIHFDFKVEENNCVYNSQAVSALICEVTDDNGNMIEKNKTIFDYLPALVNDGGYKTLGIFKLSRDGRMDKSESNSDFAMHNINEAVAAEVRKKKPGVFSYMIEELYKNKEAVFYEDESGTVQEIDIETLKDTETVTMANKLINYLMEKHDKLLDIKMFLLAGGTGSAYFNTIKEFCDKRINLKDKVCLAKNGFDGKECDPVFAIAIGLYKSMILALGE